jgi:hypothetical protein
MKIGDLIELSLTGCFAQPNPAYRGIVIKGGRLLGWLEVLFFDGDQMYYDAKDYEWNKKFWKVLNES